MTVQTWQLLPGTSQSSSTSSRTSGVPGQGVTAIGVVLSTHYILVYLYYLILIISMLLLLLCHYRLFICILYIYIISWYYVYNILYGVIHISTILPHPWRCTCNGANGPEDLDPQCYILGFYGCPLNLLIGFYGRLNGVQLDMCRV